MSSEGEKNAPSSANFFGFLVEEDYVVLRFIALLVASFLRPKKLATEVILLDDKDSFREARNFALACFALVSFVPTTVAALLASKIPDAPQKNILTTILLALVLLVTPATFIWGSRRLIELKETSFHHYCHCYAYFSGSLVIAFGIFLSAQLIINFVVLGAPSIWPMAKQSVKLCAQLDAASCILSKSRHIGAQSFWGFVVGNRTLLNIAHFVNHIIALTLFALAFLTHIILFSQKLGASWTRMVLIYVSYIVTMAFLGFFVYLIITQYALQH